MVVSIKIYLFTCFLWTLTRAVYPRQLPNNKVEYKLLPEFLKYNRTVQLVFSLGPPVCSRDSLVMTQVNTITNDVVIWRSRVTLGDTSSQLLNFINDSTVTINKAQFSEWGNYSAQCTSPSFFTYFPTPLSVPIPVLPYIFTVNFTRQEDEYIPLPTPVPTPNENGTMPEPIWPDPLPDNSPILYEFPVTLSKSIETWLLKFEVGDGYFPSGERAFFELKGLENLTMPNRVISPAKEDYNVPYTGFPHGTRYRYTFDLSTDFAASKLPSKCDFPLNASAVMKSDPVTTQHSFNVTLQLKYEAQSLTAAARMEDKSCIIRCSIQSACPLLDSLQLKIEAPPSVSLQLPSVSSEKNTFVEMRMTPNDCDTVVDLYNNNTGILKCIATNEVATITYERDLRAVSGIHTLEKELVKSARTPLPFWAKIAIPVIALLVLFLFVGIIVLCCQKSRIAKQKKRHSEALAALKKENQSQENASSSNQIPPPQQQQPPQQYHHPYHDQPYRLNQNPETISLSLTNSSIQAPSAAPPPVPVSYANAPGPARSGDYKGPVTTRGQTYEMPYQPSLVEQLNEDSDDGSFRQPVRTMPPTPGGWEVPRVGYSSQRPPQQEPVPIVTTTSPPAPRLGGNLNRSNPTLDSPQPIQVLPPIGYKPNAPGISNNQPFQSTPPIDRDDSFVDRTRKAAARYLPQSGNTAGGSPQRNFTPNQQNSNKYQLPGISPSQGTQI